jgi:hypothetical protein
MLENSNLIEGKQAKELNKLLTDYQAVVAQLDDLDTTKKNILKRIFELAPVGVNETNLFTFKVIEQAGRQSLSLKNLQESAPDLFGKVSALGLISVGEGYKVVRSIKLKGDRV